MREEKLVPTPDLSNRLIAFFSSSRLTVVLLGLIAVASFLGVTGAWGLGDIYRTASFRLLLGLLFINLLICTLDRAPATWRSIQLDSGPQAPPPPREPDFKLRLQAENPEEVMGRAEKIVFGHQTKILRRKMERGRKRPRDEKEETPQEQVLAEEGKEERGASGVSEIQVAFQATGKWGRWGPTVTHLGLLVLLLGGIISSRWSVKAYVELRPGEQSQKVSLTRNNQVVGEIVLDFTIRCNDFQVLFYPGSAMARDYLCDLSLLEEGREVARKVIEVNQPLFYKGWGIYQSSYGSYHDETSPALRLTAVRLADGTTEGHDLKLNEPWTPAGNTVSYQAIDFEEHTLGMDRDLGPSVTIQKLIGVNCLHEPCRPVEEFKLFERFPDFDARREDRFRLTFRSYPGKYFTGLQLIRDPGVPWIWSGCALIVLGVMISFFVFPRRVWITVVPRARGEFELALLGRTQKAPGMFKKNLEKMAARLETEFARERLSGPSLS